MRYKNWLQVFKSVLHESTEINARGMKCYEIENASFNVNTPFAMFDSRKLSLKYIAQEFIWYLSGDRNNTSIEKTSSFWKTVKNKEKPFYNSNYGHYFFTELQFNYVVETLKKDKDSRQAAIILNRPNVMMSNSKDKICTNAITFRIRDNKLNMTVSMRSNDLIYGSCIDIPQFWFIRMMVYACLRPTYKDLEIGTYVHNTDSLHFYERHTNMVSDIVNHKELNKDVYIPQIVNQEEVFELINKKLKTKPTKDSYQFSNFIYNHANS